MVRKPRSEVAEVAGHPRFRTLVQNATIIFLIARGKSQIGIADSRSEIPRENGKPVLPDDNSYYFEQKYTRRSYLLAFLTIT